MISAAPYRDRVVHHALCRVIEPLFEAGFVSDSYANRKGKGSHAALDRATQYARRFPYVLQCDIRLFFPSLDHEILLQRLRRRIGCLQTLRLCERILDNSNPQETADFYFEGDDLFTPFERRRGLPIGNLTSQFWANVYMDPFDHFVKDELSQLRNQNCICFEGRSGQSSAARRSGGCLTELGMVRDSGG